jgi:hypothetical protein
MSVNSLMRSRLAMSVILRQTYDRRNGLRRSQFVEMLDGRRQGAIRVRMAGNVSRRTDDTPTVVPVCNRVLAHRLGEGFDVVTTSYAGAGRRSRGVPAR